MPAVLHHNYDNVKHDVNLDVIYDDFLHVIIDNHSREVQRRARSDIMRS
jgi:hypothetical protein